MYNLIARVKKPKPDREVHVFVIDILFKPNRMLLQPLSVVQACACGSKAVESVRNKFLFQLTVCCDALHTELENIVVSYFPHCCFKTVRQEVIICIKKHDVVACSVPQSFVACCSLTAMGHPYGIRNRSIGTIVGKDKLP